MIGDFGEILVTQYNHTDGSSTRKITHASPKALISVDLLDKAWEPNATLARLNDDGSVVTISDDYGQRFIYRVGNYNVIHDAFEIEWPD